MERLTKRIGEYVYYTQGKYPDTTAAEMTNDDIRNALHKLSLYEDLELEPEQIVDMDVLYRRKCEEVARLQGFALVAENDRLRRRNASIEIRIKQLEEQLRAKESDT